MSILSKNLKLLRKESYLSFEEIVEKIGVTEDEFLKWEEEILEPNELQLEKICEVLKMPYEDIRERDLTIEREEALSQMKVGKIRKNYDWYFGSRTTKLFYIGYITYFILGLVGVFLVWRFMQSLYGDYSVLLEVYPNKTIEQIKLMVMLEDLVRCLSVYAFGTGIFMAIWFFKRHTFRFSWWYILWFSLLLTIFVIISGICCIPFFIYSIVQLFPKNRRG